MNLTLSFLRNDAKLIRRDLLLLTLLGFVVYLGVVLRFLLPWANGYLAAEGLLPSESLPHPLSHYDPLVISYMVWYTGPVLGGAIYSFLILAEKDDGTLKAMMVTPVSPARYIDHRIAMSTVFSFAIAGFLFRVINAALVPVVPALAITATAALTGPILMLFLVLLAGSKLQGVNIGKFQSLGGLLILVSWFVEGPLQHLFGLFPPWWPSKAYWLAVDGSPWWPAYVVGGLLTQVALIVAMRRACVRSFYREA
ncbi:MAG: ABC transporter permease [Myxococcota bacterium]